MNVKNTIFSIIGCFILGLWLSITINTPSHLFFVHAEADEGSPTKQTIDFEWIEKGYANQLDNVDLPLGTTKEELLAIRGTPLETGYYEGGEFFQYEDVTFFVNPETNRIVAIAMNIADKQMSIKDLKRALGTPDVSEENKMEGLWMLEYHLGKNILMFESRDNDPKSIVEYVWLRERLD